MDTTTIRQQLHNYLELADDRKIQALYALVEDSIGANTVNYAEGFKMELDNRFTAYTSGTAISITKEESNSRINSILNRSEKDAL